MFVWFVKLFLCVLFVFVLCVLFVCVDCVILLFLLFVLLIDWTLRDPN